MAINPMFLMVGGGAVLLSAAVNTARTNKALARLSEKTNLPKALSMLIVVAQVSELARTVEQTNAVNIIATLLLFSIWLATKSGAETEF